MRIRKVSIETDDLEGDTLLAELSVPAEKITIQHETTLVVMVHDFPYNHAHDHEDFFGFLRHTFNQHGYQTLLFDFQSCGDSEGREEDFTLEAARENLARVLKWAKRDGFTKYIFVGSGCGAAIALEQADEKTHMAVLFWPVVDLAAHAKRIFYEGGQRVAAQGRRLGGDLIAQMESYNPDTLKKSLKLPLLIQYGVEETKLAHVGEGLDDMIERAQNRESVRASLDDIEWIKRHFNALRIDITSYAGGGPGLTDPRHRKMVAHHLDQFLRKYA